MATYYSDNFVEIPTDSDQFEDRSPRPTRRGELIGFRASITRLPVTGDVFRFISAPEGAVLHEAIVTSTDMGTDVPGTLGWEATDADAFAADVDFEDAASTPVAAANIAAEGPLPVEDYLSITFGTVNGVSGTIVIQGTYFVP